MSPVLFSAYLRSLRRSGTVLICPRQIGQALALSRAELGRALRVSPYLLAQDKSPRLQAELRDLLRVLTVAHEQFEDIDQLIFWLMNMPMPEFQYATPFEVYATGRVSELLDCLSVSKFAHSSRDRSHAH